MICKDFSYTACPALSSLMPPKHFFLTFLILSAKGSEEKFRGTGVAQVAFHKFKKELGDRKVIN